MNKYQRLILTVAIIDLIVILLFPPFVERTLAKNAFPSFDGFYFLLSEIGRRPIDGPLLTLELFWIGANALSAWLLLSQNAGEDTPDSQYTTGIAVGAVINLLIVCLFPPFMQYSSLLHPSTAGFDSFYFVFGDRSARPLYLPLLQLEIFFVLINALALYLLFGAVRRGQVAEQERRTLAASGPRDKTPGRAPKTPEEILLDQQHEAARLATIGRKVDRRHHADPNYRGRERRKGQERRHTN